MTSYIADTALTTNSWVRCFPKNRSRSSWRLRLSDLTTGTVLVCDTNQQTHCDDGPRQKMTTGKTVDLRPPASNEAKAEVRVSRAATRRKSKLRLGREIQACLGQQLRATYDAVVTQRVPLRIAELIHRLSDHDDGVA